MSHEHFCITCERYTTGGGKWCQCIPRPTPSDPIPGHGGVVGEGNRKGPRTGPEDRERRAERRGGTP